MPKRPSSNVAAKYVEFRPELASQLQDLADQNGRTFKDELMHAVERHLAEPPRVIVTTPPMSPASIEQAVAPQQPPEVEPPAKRGRAAAKGRVNR